MKCVVGVRGRCITLRRSGCTVVDLESLLLYFLEMLQDRLGNLKNILQTQGRKTLFFPFALIVVSSIPDRASRALGRLGQHTGPTQEKGGSSGLGRDGAAGAEGKGTRGSI